MKGYALTAVITVAVIFGLYKFLVEPIKNTVQERTQRLERILNAPNP